MQRRKIEDGGLEAFFDGIHVTDMDKKLTLASIVGDRARASVMVGDSKKIDVEPAVELGMTAVWIPSQTWNFAKSDIDQSRYREIASVRELPELIRMLEKK